MLDYNHWLGIVVPLFNKKRKRCATQRSKEMELDESFVSLSVLEEQRRLRNRKCYNIEGWAGAVPNEIWVDCMKFLKRSSLEKLQLTSGRFDLLVYKYFSVYPLRHVKSCTISSTKNGKTKVVMACFSKDDDSQNMIESDSDLQLWLRNCNIETCRFYDFNFSNRLIDEITKINPESLVVRHCIFDYERKLIKGNREIKEEHLFRLFTLPSFFKCKGAIFSFDKSTTWYRPSFHCLLSLPLSTLVIDFDFYECSVLDVDDIAKWLNNEPIILRPKNTFNSNDEMEVDEDETTLKAIKYPSTRTLSVRNIEFANNEFTRLVDTLKMCFLKDTTQKRPFILETDYDPDNDWNLSLVNKSTNERFIVTANVSKNASIQRIRI